jgi:hypothetical protein
VRVRDEHVDDVHISTPVFLVVLVLISVGLASARPNYSHEISACLCTSLLSRTPSVYWDSTFELSNFGSLSQSA